MLDFTTVISFKHSDGLYKMAEVFIYQSPSRIKKLIVVDSDGFKDPIEMQHLTAEFNDYIETMFGNKQYILMFNHNSDIYIYQRSAGNETMEIEKSTTGMTSAIEYYINTLMDYYV